MSLSTALSALLLLAPLLDAAAQQRGRLVAGAVPRAAIASQDSTVTSESRPAARAVAAPKGAARGAIVGGVGGGLVGALGVFIVAESADRDFGIDGIFYTIFVPIGVAVGAVIGAIAGASR
jgi:predicted lipid-binding transport protein (Tim44 family)